MRKIKNWELNVPMFLTYFVSIAVYLKLVQTLDGRLFTPALLTLWSLIAIHMIMRDLLAQKANYILTYVVHALLAFYTYTIVGFAFPNVAVIVAITTFLLPTIIRFIGRYKRQSAKIKEKASLFDYYFNN